MINIILGLQWDVYFLFLKNKRIGTAARILDTLVRI